MKKRILFFLLCFMISVQIVISQNINNVLNSSANFLNNSGQPITNNDVVKGLKEALTIGTNNSAANASMLDGYYRNPLIKIPFPPDAKKMETELRKMGRSKDVDKFVMTVNRAAEEAAKDAAPIFINAITSMDIADGIAILKGADDAATIYLKNKTSADLKAKFKPIIRQAIQKVELTKYWNPLAKTYNRIPFVQKINPDIEEYTTLKALEGLFKLLVQEELKIRKDPTARITDILKKVFG